MHTQSSHTYMEKTIMVTHKRILTDTRHVYTHAHVNPFYTRIYIHTCTHMHILICTYIHTVRYTLTHAHLRRLSLTKHTLTHTQLYTNSHTHRYTHKHAYFDFFVLIFFDSKRSGKGQKKEKIPIKMLLSLHKPLLTPNSANTENPKSKIRPS